MEFQVDKIKLRVLSNFIKTEISSKFNKFFPYNLNLQIPKENTIY